MNNQQFRRLLNAENSQNGQPSPKTSRSQPSSLGTKRSSLIPMTPRAVKGGIDVDFARQVRERNAAFSSAQPGATKKFKSAAPKGVKYGAGYTDRAKARQEAQDAGDDEKVNRIKALEEQVKLGQISQGTFEELRDQIAGGDVGSTHLVKGLDRKLLERVRRGEDVLGIGSGDADGGAVPDVEDELDRLGEKEVEVVRKERVEKKGVMAPPPVAGKKRSRDEIMAELKAQRKAAAEARAAPALDANKWRKVGAEKSRIEIDHKGREVLITVDEDGVVKRKVRKVPVKTAEAADDKKAVPDANKPVLGADFAVPAAQPEVNQQAEEDDDDIFEGVGTEYNPLGNDEGSDSSSEDESDADKEDGELEEQATPVRVSDEEDMAGEEDDIDEHTTVEKDALAAPAAPRNYFNDTVSTTQPGEDRLAGVEDFVKRAVKLESSRVTDGDEEDHGDDEEQKARLKRRAEMLAARDRDLDDMDMGFGVSRYDDGEEEGDSKKVRLSEWKGGAHDGWEEKEKGDGKKKRKPKKRKGDANNMSDIMRVIEGRRGAAK